MSDDGLDQTNRLLIVVLALVGVFVALLVVLLAWSAPAGTISRVIDFSGYLRDHNNREAKTIVSLGAAVVVLLMLTVIIVEITPSPTQRMRVRNLKSGGATITTTAIASRIDTAVLEVPHVAACVATVAARGKRAEIVLDLHVDPGADLAETADAACGSAQALVEREMGIELATRPRARLHYRELRLRGDGSVTEASSPGRQRWQRPEGDLDERRSTDTSEEAQA